MDYFVDIAEMAFGVVLVRSLLRSTHSNYRRAGRTGLKDRIEAEIVSLDIDDHVMVNGCTIMKPMFI